MTDALPIDEQDQINECAVCAERIVPGQEWIGLNRYAYGDGAHRGMSESQVDDEYLWHTDEDIEEELATLMLLHWPICAQMFVDAKLAGLRGKYRSAERDG